MSSAIIRVKRHIDDAPVEALRLAKRRRVSLCDSNNDQDRDLFQSEVKSAARGVMLAFVGTVERAVSFSLTNSATRSSEKERDKERSIFMNLDNGFIFYFLLTYFICLFPYQNKVRAKSQRPKKLSSSYKMFVT